MNLKLSKDAASFLGKIGLAATLAWLIGRAMSPEQFGAIEAFLTGFVCHSLLSLAETVYCRLRRAERVWTPNKQ